MPGDRSPPPAPKHSTAASRPKAPKQVAPNRRVLPESTSSFTSINPVQPTPAASFNQDQFSAVSHSFRDDDSIAQDNIESSSIMADEEFVPMSQHSTQSRKRKRGINEINLDMIEHDHIKYGDELLDYFMTVGDASAASRITPPQPPPHFQVDRPIDDHGNTALHWACSMGDIEIVRDLLNRGANAGSRSDHDETPLVRAVLFTNNYEKGTMQELADLLQSTIMFRDWYGATVFNHLAATTKSKGKWKSSKYYCQVLIDKLNQLLPSHEISLLLSSQDSSGDTAALSAARNGCYRLATTLLAQCPDAGDIANKAGETANDILQTLSRRHRDNNNYHTGSSVAPQSIHENEQISLNDGNDANNPGGGSISQSTTNEATSTFIARVGSIIEDANRKLALAYGDLKSAPQGTEDITNPQGLYEHVESDRQNIRNQMAELAAKGEGSEQFESQINRLNRIKGDYELLLEHKRKTDLVGRFNSAGCSDSSQDARVAELQRQQHQQRIKNSPHELAQVYQLARELFEAQQAGQQAIRELIQQRADAGVSTKLDVHRKLVSLATGLGEDELDPMSSELADTLEFDRTNEKRSNTQTPDGNGNGNGNGNSSRGGDDANNSGSGGGDMELSKQEEAPRMATFSEQLVPAG